jgi:hypothetical protein
LPPALACLSSTLRALNPTVCAPPSQVRRLVEAGFVTFAEPCIVECHDGPAACESCINATGGSGEAHALAAAADRGGPTVKIAKPSR